MSKSDKRLIPDRLHGQTMQKLTKKAPFWCMNKGMGGKKVKTTTQPRPAAKREFNGCPALRGSTLQLRA